MRGRTYLLIAVGAVVFIGISVELARYLTGVSAERSEVYRLLTDQARGDADAVIARLSGCAEDPACVERTRALTARLKRPGEPKILNYESQTSSTLGTKSGRSRVAWAIVKRNGFPVIQCVTLSHSWSFVHGSSVSLRRISAPIGNEAGC